MECPICHGQTRRFGRNRNGSQRYRCDTCRRTFTPADPLIADGRRVDAARMNLAIRMLLEGNSIRSTERLTGIYRNTIIAAVVSYGQACKAFMERTIFNTYVEDVQADEIWGFVGCKERTRERRDYPEVMGDAYCFTAIERTTKLLIAWHLGKRCPEDTRSFAEKLWHATNGRFQLTTDGFTPYLTAIPEIFGRQLDYATLVKVYGESLDEHAQRRYSPARITEVVATPRIGSPDDDRICTSHVERHNLTIRTQVRRMTRLTNAFSKKWENHEAALALFFAYYSFCRVHSAIKTTPAVKAGLAERPWSVQEMLAKAVAAD
jgi:transposase-like protein/IS1 family transposase